MNDNKKQLIENTLLRLISSNGSTTTLDIKQDLRISVPLDSWYQDDISDVVDEIFSANKIPNLVFKNVSVNGFNFREYFIEQKTTEQKVTKTDLAEKIMAFFDSNTSPITLEILKPDQTTKIREYYVRTFSPEPDVFGYLNVFNQRGEPRKLDLRKVIAAKIHNVLYHVK